MTRTARPLRLALIGAGAMGSLHARVIGQHDAARLVTVIDPDERAGRAIAERHGARWRPDLSSSAEFDAGIVASPTPTHALWTGRLIELDCPVMVEKPLTANVADTEAMLALAADRDVPLMCGFVERFNAAVEVAAQIIKQPLQLQSLRHSPYAPRVRGGVGLDLLIHDVDLALRLFGAEPTRVRATAGFLNPASEPGAEDVLEVHLGFAAGSLASLSASRIAQQKLRQLRILDLDRTLEVDLIRQDVTVFRHVGNTFDDSGAYRQQTVIDIPVVSQRREPLTAQLDHFLALVRGEADHVTERQSVLPPHVTIERILAAAADTAADAAPGAEGQVASGTTLPSVPPTGGPRPSESPAPGLQ